jgi:hypothetical protein
VAPVVEGYMEDLKQALEGNVSPRDSLDAIVERSLKDMKDVKKTALWWHFASFALRLPLPILSVTACTMSGMTW